MRKYQQVKILESLRTLEEAHDELRKQPVPEACGDLLTDCQNFAIQIGESIEDIVGEDSQTETIRLLEEYCDIVFEISKGGGRVKKLRSQLVKIVESVKYELRPDRIEVVFFPYQLSMWDSFKSVYEAAKADPDCDAYCVPIPWYDKRPDGTFGVMRYDGDQYPAEVGAVDWRSYNVSERRPDVIFFQNHYDNNNFVSSVHPDYYCSKLKGETELLVHIDYGIAFQVGIKPIDANQKSILQPGHILCDVWVTYSKKHAERVAAWFRHGAAAGLFPKETAARDRFAALGSPKFDAVINAKREDFILPDEWRRIVEGKKKTILFSTCVTAVLRGNENFLKRLRDIIKIFSQSKSFALWWRPHPLSESTYKSMRPQFYEEYMSIVDEYKSQGWGIYDDTPDVTRAIVWSDACYTDESSLQYLYLATGKPFTVRYFTRYPKDMPPDESSDFTPILAKRIANMQAARGANVLNQNCVIWWQNFADADFAGNVRYDKFWRKWLNFILNESKYPQAELYRQLKLEMFRDSVENADGTAGEKIYRYIKSKSLKSKP